MATLNPYAGDVIEFPAGTPAGVINAYYAAVLRNQALAQAQKQARYDPWVDTFENFQKQVLNPYLNRWLGLPFEDYRKTYDVNEAIRQEQERQTGLVGSAQQIDINKYLQDQIEREALGRSIGGLLDVMQPTTETTVTDTGVTEPYGPHEDMFNVPAGPMFPDYNPYAGAVAPEAVPMAADATIIEERPPGPGMRGAAGAPTDLDRYPPDQYKGQRARNSATGELFISDGVQWKPVGVEPAPSGIPEEPYVGPSALPAAAPAPAPPAPAPAGSLPGPIPGSVVPPLTGQPSRFVTAATTTTTPSMSDALRLLAGIDPTRAGMITEALQKNQNLASILDPRRQEKMDAEIARILSQGKLGEARADDLAATLQARLDVMGAKTRESEAKALALEQRNAMIARATDDYYAGRIGKEEMMILHAVAHGKTGGGKGTGGPQETKTFLTALASVMADPANAGKSEHEMRELASQWLANQAEEIERRKALGRGATARPAANQLEKHTGYQSAASQLGAISELMPRVNLDKVVGYMSPWLNRIAATGMTEGGQLWGAVPPIPVPDEVARTLTRDDHQFLALTKEYADTVLRLRSGAQINEAEMKRMIDFLPTDSAKPEAFRARFSTAFDNLDRWFVAFYRQSRDYKQMIPEESKMRQIVRRGLKDKSLPYHDANVETFIANPSNKPWLDAQMGKP